MDKRTPPPLPGANFRQQQFPPRLTPNQPPRPTPGNKPGNPWLWVGIILAVLALVAVSIYLFFAFRTNDKHKEEVEVYALAEKETDPAPDAEEVPISIPQGNTDSLPEIAETQVPPEEDGRGGFDDNAEGYFQQWADEYMTSDRHVKFKGTFSNSDGSWPIALTFDMDSNYFPGICHYTNVRYGTKATMSVRFTEYEMHISGNAGGSDFTLHLKPASGGAWSGTAQNGNNRLNAEIHPVSGI